MRPKKKNPRNKHNFDLYATRTVTWGRVYNGHLRGPVTLTSRFSSVAVITSFTTYFSAAGIQTPNLMEAQRSL